MTIKPQYLIELNSIILFHKKQLVKKFNMLLEKTFLIISTAFLISLIKIKEALIRFKVLHKEIQLIFFIYFSVLMSVEMQNKSCHLFLNLNFHQFIFTAKLNYCEIKFVGEMSTKFILK
jgi:hypothetical protein